MSHGGAARVRHFQPRVVIFQCRTNDRASSVLSYDHYLKIVYRLLRRWRNASECRLPSKNAHIPNYCSWLAVCVH